MKQDDHATELDPDDAEGLIPGHIRTRVELDEWEQTNIAAAQSWLSRRRTGSVLSMTFVRELHRRMFDQTWSWAGQFRKSMRNIGVHQSQIAEQLGNLLEDVRYQISQEEIEADEIAVRFHHRLVYIHPFPNGNGRHARLLTNLLLQELGTEPFTWGSARIEEIGTTRAAYIAALKAADAGDYRLLREFVKT